MSAEAPAEALAENINYALGDEVISPRVREYFIEHEREIKYLLSIKPSQRKYSGLKVDSQEIKELKKIFGASSKEAAIKNLVDALNEHPACLSEKINVVLASLQEIKRREREQFLEGRRQERARQTQEMHERFAKERLERENEELKTKIALMEKEQQEKAEKPEEETKAEKPEEETKDN